MTDFDDLDIDTDRVTEHPPDTDIDQYIEDCNFRIERMSFDGLWICAYTGDPDEPDHHYDLTVTDDGGIHVTHRKEGSPVND
ncbi:hypothetical protein SY89_02719 [Halolamina pelagica]|uniref:Uncharacterized protein n=1 Tax=Halolamina pelagica TaxID=699431 RepID=A0A0P7I4R7_9EURY|nr:hypothetical protein [Halolamina pelagica]KPN31962.1 hypothetical protein SY89_02719 [Halolamina pelagica]